MHDPARSPADPGPDSYAARFPGHWDEGLSGELRAIRRDPENDPTAPRFKEIRFHRGGGLGEVYKAYDRELKRCVALKKLRRDRDASPDVELRFVREAVITGGLEHPNVVSVYSLGRDRAGRSSYAMRFIQGESLQAAIDRFHDAEGRGRGDRAMVFRGLLRRFVDACNAMAYAHDKQVLHRDLKPENIMVGRYGETLVVDWGLAKVIGRADPSGTAGQAPPGDGTGTAPSRAGGTLPYMSPEQVQGDAGRVGLPSDIYSLGATLYCLLTGRLPFPPPHEVEGGMKAVLRMIRDGGFPRPRAVRRAVPPTLEKICLKAMALQPEDRYASPRLLAYDIEHWLADEPVPGVREPLRTRVRRWVSHHRTLVVAAAVAAVMAVVALEIARERAIFEAARLAQSTKKSGYREEVLGLISWRSIPLLRAAGAVPRVKEELLKVAVGCIRDPFGIEPGTIDLRDWTTSGVAPGTFKVVAVRPGANPHAIEIADVKIAVPGTPKDPGPRAEPGPPIGPEDGLTAVVAAGRQLVYAGHDGTIWVWGRAGRDGWTSAGKASFSPSDHLLGAITPDGNSLAVSARRSSTIWMSDLSGRNPVLGKCEYAGRELTCLAFDARGRRLAVGYRRGDAHRVSVWAGVDASRATLGSEEAQVESRSGEVLGVAFSPNGQFLAVCSEGVAVFEAVPAEAGEGRLVYQPYLFVGGDQSNDAAFSPDNELLACTGTQRHEVKVWSTSTRRSVAVLGHAGPVCAVVFSGNGRTLVAAGPRTIRTWDLGRARERGVLAGHVQGVPGVAFSPDGTRLVSISKDRTVRVWDPVNRVPLGILTRLKDYGQAIAFSPDGTRLAIGDWTGTVQIWEGRPGRIERWKPAFSITPQLGEQIWALGFSRDGRHLGAGGKRGLTIWQVTDQGLVPEKCPRRDRPVTRLCFDDIGGASKRLAWVEEGREVDGVPSHHLRLWDLEAETVRTPARPYPLLNEGVLSVAFLPGGQRLTFVDRDWNIKEVDAGTGEIKSSLGPRPKEVGGSVLALSPDGAWLAVQSGLAAEVWDAKAKKLLFRLPEESGIVWCLAWNPVESWDRGQRLLAVGTSDGGLFLWDINKLRAELDRIGLGW
jgi:WD40 repeat protein/tRNA A-37 threonylcarbamoyl transferase component Bud32